MSRLYPGHQMRVRRFRVACILGVLGLVLACMFDLWPSGAPVSNELPWLRPLLGLSAIVLAITCVVLLLAYLRELKRLDPIRHDEV